MEYSVESSTEFDIVANFYCSDCGNLTGKFSVNEFSRQYPTTSFRCKRCDLKLWDEIFKNRKIVLNDKMIDLEGTENGRDFD